MNRYPQQIAEMTAVWHRSGDGEISLDIPGDDGVVPLPAGWGDYDNAMRDKALTAAGWTRVRPWTVDFVTHRTVAVRTDDQRPIAASVALLAADGSTIDVEDAAESYAGHADHEHYSDLYEARDLAPRITAVWRDAHGRELTRRILHDEHERAAIARARQSAEATEYHRAEVGRHAAARAATVRQMRETMPIAVVAAALGISEAAVTKLVKQAPPE